MSRSLLLAIIIVLAFLGLADTWYLSQAALTNTALNCGIEALDQCNTVAQSEYSRFVGIPLALYGFAFYVVFFVFASLITTLSRPIFVKLLFLISALGFLLSVYFLYLQIYVIEALCIYCLASFVVATLLFLATWRLKKRELAISHPVVP
jgi:uncharacterized membrane protein